jgi:putative transposase
MYKTLIIPVKCNKQDYEYLKQCNKLSAEVWNLCLKLNKEYKEKNDRYINNSELQKATKKCIPLHSHNIHHVVHKYLFARDSIIKARRAEISLYDFYIVRRAAAWYYE